MFLIVNQITIVISKKGHVTSNFLLIKLNKKNGKEKYQEEDLVYQNIQLFVSNILKKVTLLNTFYLEKIEIQMLKYDEKNLRFEKMSDDV